MYKKVVDTSGGPGIADPSLPTTRRRAPVSSQATLASATCTLQSQSDCKTT